MAAIPETQRAWHSGGYNQDPKAAVAALVLTDAARVPQPTAGQVLIKVHFASVNPIDWKLLTGGYKDFFAVENFPLTPGFDISGIVVAVGPEVTTIQVGDRVAVDIGCVESCKVGTNFGPAGAFAEYAVSPASQLSKIPASLSLSTAAAIPLAGLTSYQTLFTGHATSMAGEPLADVKEGSKVLVLGGASGTGHLAVQMAKIRGAYVATTASPNTLADGRSKLDFVKSLGADLVINYKEEDWGTVLKGQDFDLVYDCVGAPEDPDKAVAVLRPGGQFITIVNFGAAGTKEERLFKIMIVRSNGEDLDQLVQWAVEGKLKVHVDKIFKFEETPQALLHSIDNKATGKVVIQIAAE